MPTGSVTDEIAGSQLRIRIFVGNGTWACVSNVACSRRAYGDEQTVNDLRRTEYLFEDDLGMWEFNGLRKWVSNLYNGNRGADWSKYPARSGVQLDGNPIFFSGRRRYSIFQDAATNLVVNAGGRNAITVSFRGASGASGSFVATSFAKTNSTVYIGYTIDADNFDPAYLGVQTCEILNDVWYDMPPGSYTATANTVTIPNQTSATAFYRLKYGNMTTDALDIRLCGNVIVEDALILKGLDGVYYNLSVSNGVISATAVE